MGQNGGSAARSSRCIALVGPYLSGKTSLLEAILTRSGGITRQGKVPDKNTVGDAFPEARDHGMSVEVNVADTGRGISRDFLHEVALRGIPAPA